MKVLFVFKENDNYPNKYISSLKTALINEGIDAVCSVDDFWNNYQKYDIIHFQLLESSLFKQSTDKIFKQISRIKENCKVIVTCHDLILYYADPDGSKKKFLEYIYNYCDAIIHLGINSLEYLKNKSNKNIKHYIISHHIYNNIYQFSMDKSLARKQLKIPLDANVLLCFGSFRNDIERNLVLKAWEKVNVFNKYLLAPGFCRVRRNIILGYKQVFKALYYKTKNVHFKNQFIPHEAVETYLCAADVLMIQRSIILNSGNLSLGFHAQKVVVGPDIGNVGPILKERENPTFDPCDISSVIVAIEEGFRLKNTNLPHKNYEYAIKNWNVQEIARKHIEVYKEICNP
jgi:hypothetical protein